MDSLRFLIFLGLSLGIACQVYAQVSTSGDVPPTILGNFFRRRADRQDRVADTADTIINGGRNIVRTSIQILNGRRNISVNSANNNTVDKITNVLKNRTFTLKVSDKEAEKVNATSTNTTNESSTPSREQTINDFKKRIQELKDQLQQLEEKYNSTEENSSRVSNSSDNSNHTITEIPNKSNTTSSTESNPSDKDDPELLMLPSKFTTALNQLGKVISSLKKDSLSTDKDRIKTLLNHLDEFADLYGRLNKYISLEWKPVSVSDIETISNSLTNLLGDLTSSPSDDSIKAISEDENSLRNVIIPQLTELVKSGTSATAKNEEKIKDLLQLLFDKLRRLYNTVSERLDTFLSETKLPDELEIFSKIIAEITESINLLYNVGEFKVTEDGKTKSKQLKEFMVDLDKISKSEPSNIASELKSLKSYITSL